MMYLNRLLALLLFVLGPAQGIADTSAPHQIAWEGGGALEVTPSFVQDGARGLCLEIKYTNRAKTDIYLESHDEVENWRAGFRLILDSDLPSGKAPKDWKAKPSDKGGEAVSAEGFPDLKKSGEKIAGGQSITRRFPLEKTYVRITDLHVSTNIYILWSKKERVYSGDPASGPAKILAQGRIGGFYNYLKSTSP